ncbi:MAG: pyruvate dehydrogenase (acetyl-transferring) E1 component subunit alpha [Planctomycetota bacterium]|jgi:pyruvate dehydrogenase E1 component alpha subunit
MPRKTLQTFEVQYLQVMDCDGNVDKKLMPSLSHQQIKELYELMVLVRMFDDKAFKLQRQGRLGTYLQAKGQEASQVGAAYALKEEDWLFPSGRDVGTLITRNHPLHMLLQYRGGDERGVKAPEGLNNFPITIPVSTQIPHTTGSAWASKMLGERAVHMTFFGDGATSRSDFHEGLNFAGLFKVPAVFICENNGYAISLPRARQTAAETLAQRAFSYGIEGIQVDGNDVFAVYSAAAHAVEKARQGGCPTLIECVTYRTAGHSTSDDDLKYRSKEEVEEWQKKDPIERLERYMRGNRLLTDKSREDVLQRVRQRVEKAVEDYENVAPPRPIDLFTNTYARPTNELKEQMNEFTEGPDG